MATTVRKLRKVCVAARVAYLGTPYSGSQELPNMRTVEGDFVAALAGAGLVAERNAVGSKCGLKRMARTDRGVHALGNVFRARVQVPRGEEGLAELQGDKVMAWLERINAAVPIGGEIEVLSLRHVPQSFNARRWCERRNYHYLLPAALLPADITLEQVTRAWAQYEGVHCFKYFFPPRLTWDVHHTGLFRTIHSTSVHVHPTPAGDYFALAVEGNAFVLHQIRRMVCGLVLELRNDGQQAAPTIADLLQLARTTRPFHTKANDRARRDDDNDDDDENGSAYAEEQKDDSNSNDHEDHSLGDYRDDSGVRALPPAPSEMLYLSHGVFANRLDGPNSECLRRTEAEVQAMARFERDRVWPRIMQSTASDVAESFIESVATWHAHANGNGSGNGSGSV